MPGGNPVPSLSLSSLPLLRCCSGGVVLLLACQAQQRAGSSEIATKHLGGKPGGKGFRERFLTGLPGGGREIFSQRFL